MKMKIQLTPDGNYLVTLGTYQFTVNASAIKAMRDWVSDCVWAEDCETVEFTDAEILRGVNRHFDGGIPAFLQSI